MFPLLLIFLISGVFAINADNNTYECSPETYSCTLFVFRKTNETNPIKPNSHKIKEISTINLIGIIPYLSSKVICKEMPQLFSFNAKNVSLEVIEDNAFEGCKQLRILELDQNNFKTIGRKALKDLRKLVILSISGGNIPIFDLDLTELKELGHLKLVNLGITVFRADVLREQKKLYKLELQSNNLLDLDVDSIVKHLPQLETFNLDDNAFECDRLLEVHEILEEKNIRRETFYRFNEDISDFRIYLEKRCLNNSEWGKRLLSLPLEQRSFYIGNEVKQSENRDLDRRLTKLEEKLDHILEILGQCHQLELSNSFSEENMSSAFGSEENFD